MPRDYFKAVVKWFCITALLHMSLRLINSGLGLGFAKDTLLIVSAIPGFLLLSYVGNAGK